MNRPIPLCVASLCALSAGCGVTMTDDVDTDFNFAQLVGASDALHSPYVRGAGMRLYARVNDDNRNMTGWTMVSSDPSVFRIEKVTDGKRISADCTAVGQGTAVVTVKNAQGGDVHSEVVRVRLPDRAQLLAHGPLLIGRPDEEAVMSDAKLVQGGEGTFLVRWFADGEQLSGHGSMSVEAPKALMAKAETTSFFEDRDWLQVTGLEVGAAQVKLFADGEPVGSFPITVVAKDAVDRVELRGEDESHHSDGDMLAVLAQGYAGSEPVFGVELSWTLGGESQQGLGDLFRYALDSKRPKALTATVGTLQATAMIHAKEGYVSSTNKLGCSVAGPRGAGWSTVLCVGAALFFARRRRGG
jgi:hypothetical protein